MNLIFENDADELHEHKKIKCEIPVYDKTYSYDDLIHMSKVLSYQDDFFTDDLYKYSLNFYDFEVFPYDWMVVIINPFEHKKIIIVNDINKLKSYYELHKNQIFCGYNSRHYDTYIFKSLLLGINPKKINDCIIDSNSEDWKRDYNFKSIQFYDFDIMKDQSKSLKQLEAFMGSSVEETEVDFNINRCLTKDEILLSVKYCIHDVEQSIEVFKYQKEEYNAQLSLIETFDVDLNKVSLTQTQLTTYILGCERETHDDEFDLTIIKNLKISKYSKVVKWFRSHRNYGKMLNCDVCSIPHSFGWGGLHGCPSTPLHMVGRIFHIDVTSYYPSIMIQYNFLTRNCKNANKFRKIYDKRVALKKAGKKKEQAPYKIILNATYGASKDRYSPAYDPLQANNVCVNGQLMLLDLLEHLEDYCYIIQSNTDGLIIKINDDVDTNTIMQICQEWQDRTGMGLGFDEIDEIWQKDVNNYIFRFTNGKLERKGSYVKELNNLDYDLPIINDAVVNYITSNIPIEKTINECSDLRKFQKVVKVSSNYKCAWHNGVYLKNKIYRVFASNNAEDTYIGKSKILNGKVEKFANCPTKCFINNKNIIDSAIPKKLDKTWYIQMAKKRLDDFGIKMIKSEEGLL